MSDETKKKPAKEAKAPAEKAPKADKPQKPEKAEKTEKAEKAEKAPKATATAEAPKAGGGDAPAAAPAAPTAAELLGEDPNAKKIIKAKHAKNISIGSAHILATFNNTQVTITDMQGNLHIGDCRSEEH